MGSVRDNKDLDIYECCDCGLVFLSNHDHIDEEFYKESNMHPVIDFEKWKIDTIKDDKRRFDFVSNIIMNKSVLDFGSGNAGFLSYAKEVTKYACGVELEKAVKDYYEMQRIDLFSKMDDIKSKFDVITSFHVLEHLQDPLKILKQMKTKLNTEGKIIVEVPNANDALLSIYENDAFSNFTYWSCHLYLYTDFTLRLLAKKADLKVDFVKHIQRYPLSNHLHWLSKGKPGGDKIWGSFIDSGELNTAYENQLASVGATDTLLVQFSK